jgi:hypothetical protein
MLVLSGVFNKIILGATNYANQVYARQLQLHTYTRYIADWSIIVHCHLLVILGI